METEQATSGEPAYEERLYSWALSIYNAERQEPDRLYARFPLVLTQIALLSGLVVALTKLGYLSRIDETVIILYFAAGIGSVGLLSLAVASLCSSLLSRGYKRFPLPITLVEWVSSYSKDLRQQGEFSDEEIRRACDNHLRSHLIQVASRCTSHNRQQNDSRTAAYCAALRRSVYALAPILCYGLLRGWIGAKEYL